MSICGPKLSVLRLERRKITINISDNVNDLYLYDLYDLKGRNPYWGEKNFMRVKRKECMHGLL